MDLDAMEVRLRKIEERLGLSRVAHPAAGRSQPTDNATMHFKAAGRHPSTAVVSDQSLFEARALSSDKISELEARIAALEGHDTPVAKGLNPSPGLFPHPVSPHGTATKLEQPPDAPDREA